MGEPAGIISGTSSHLPAADFVAGLWERHDRVVYSSAAAADSKNEPGAKAESQATESNLLSHSKASHRGRSFENGAASGDTFLGDSIGLGTGPQAILTDIEELLLGLLHCLSQGALPDFHVVKFLGRSKDKSLQEA